MKKKFDFRPGETKTVEVNFGPFADLNNTSVSSVSWSVYSGQGTISSVATNGNVTQCLVTAQYNGDTEIKCTATMADGQVVVQEIEIVTRGFG